MEFVVKLVETDDLEDFEENDDNIGSVRVFDDKGNEITKSCRVQLTLSKNGLIGLGTELIRMAHNTEIGRHKHIDPSTSEDNACQTMGIFLVPNSSELIIEHGLDGDIGDYIED